MFEYKGLMKFVAGGVGLFVAACGGAPTQDGTEQAEVNVYSGRHYDGDLAIYAAFTEETGIKVNLIEASGDALIERLAQEGENSPADLFITADAGVLWRAQNKGVLQASANEALATKIPAQYQHPEGYWFGLSRRARVIIYNKDQGLPEGMDSYADLADPELDGKICIRSSTNVYNQSLLASRIAHDGEEEAKNWARGVMANFARNPQGNDTAQIEAVAAGLCRFGVVNTYYVARFVETEDSEKAAIGDKLGVLFPDTDGRGVHVNISGAGVTKHAPNADNAEALLDFLLRDETQAKFASVNNEYPVVAGVDAIGPVASLGTFNADTLPVTSYGEYQAAAVAIFDEIGWP